MLVGIKRESHKPRLFLRQGGAKIGRTGRFNLMQGAMNTCVAIGGSLSNLIAGFVAEGDGYGAGFIALTVIALLALAFFWVVMPETGGMKHGR